jgi:hypothetical protein
MQTLSALGSLNLSGDFGSSRICRWWILRLGGVVVALNTSLWTCAAIGVIVGGALRRTIVAMHAA